MNDLFDLEVGTDTADYPRNLYSPHPVISGVVTRKRLAVYALVRQRAVPRDHDLPHRRARLADRRVRARWLPPLRRVHRAAAAVEEARTRRADRHRGLGSADGRRRLLRGHRLDPGAVLLASLPYAILCTTVLMGKHIDKAPWDGPAGTHTLPVILGDGRGAPGHPRHVRGLLRDGRRPRDRADPAGRDGAGVRVDAAHGAGLEGLRRAQAGRVAVPEPGLAPVVRARIRSW